MQSPDQRQSATSGFFRSVTGSVAIFFALSAVAVIGLVGATVDYGRAASIREKLTTAADAAALGAIQSGGSDATLDLAGRAAKAKQIFFASTQAISGVKIGNVTADVSKSGGALTARVSYAATLQTTLARVLGSQFVNIGNSVTATGPSALYNDVYFLLDVSASMGIPTTLAGQTALFNLTGCTFACHYKVSGAYPWKFHRTYNPSVNSDPYATPQTNIVTTYEVARTLGLMLRIDEMKGAVTQLLAAIKSGAAVASDYKTGVYSFANRMAVSYPLSADLNGAIAAVAGLTMESGSPSSPVGNGGTMFANVMTSMNNTISMVGDGSSATQRKPIVFFVTDGMNTPHTYTPLDDWVGTSTDMSAFDPSTCAALKSRGVTIAVLYTQYRPVASNLMPDTTDPFNQVTGVHTESVTINALLQPTDRVENALQACASPGLFMRADQSTSIATAMNSLFRAAVGAPRLTR